MQALLHLLMAAGQSQPYPATTIVNQKLKTRKRIASCYLFVGQQERCTLSNEDFRAANTQLQKTIQR